MCDMCAQAQAHVTDLTSWGGSCFDGVDRRKVI